MNRKELKIKLDELNIPETSYSLFGGMEILKTILDWRDKWIIYEIDERGNNHEIAVFDDEEQACVFFYNTMKKHYEIMLKSYEIPIEQPDAVRSIFIVSKNGMTTN